MKLHGLRNAAERNGQVGVVKSFDEAAGRYLVTLRDGTPLKLKPANLLQMVQVRLLGLEGEQARHNDAQGTIFDYDEASAMYGVELEGGDAMAVALANVLLPDGSFGTVHGLQSAPQYNETLAQVIQHVPEAGRYVVRVAGNKQLRLKRQNLRI